MPVVQINAELSVEQLINAVMQLPQREFEEFSLTLSKIHPLHEAHRLSARESQLLLDINQGIPSGMQHRYDELIEKRDTRSLTDEEYAELLQLTDQVELLDAKRMESLLELAHLRKQPLPLLMKELGLTPPANA